MNDRRTKAGVCQVKFCCPAGLTHVIRQQQPISLGHSRMTHPLFAVTAFPFTTTGPHRWASDFLTEQAVGSHLEPVA
jgi:hypothetical protein